MAKQPWTTLGVLSKHKLKELEASVAKDGTLELFVDKAGVAQIRQTEAHAAKLEEVREARRVEAAEQLTAAAAEQAAVEKAMRAAAAKRKETRREVAKREAQSAVGLKVGYEIDDASMEKLLAIRDQARAEKDPKKRQILVDQMQKLIDDAGAERSDVG